MWVALLAAFVLVTVTFGKSEHLERSTTPVHPQPAVAEVAEQAAAGLARPIHGGCDCRLADVA
jgi:hypothetical protein